MKQRILHFIGYAIGIFTCAKMLLLRQRFFTVVTAAHNSSPYLNQFFESLINQSISFERYINVVFVDDGSTDDTSAVVSKWVQQYPDNIFYVKQPHNGQAAATNRGLTYVRSAWVSFIDSDDFVSEDYFQTVFDFLFSHWTHRIRIISCNVFFYREEARAVEDLHPLRFRFASSIALRPISDLGPSIQISASTCVFRHNDLQKAKTRFDSRIIPHFLDGLFVNLLMLEYGSGSIAFLQQPKYFYRKRAALDSATDTSWDNRGRYINVPRDGFLGLLKRYNAACGRAPLHIQRTVLYEIMFHIRRFAGEKDGPLALNAVEREHYFALIFDILSYIDVATIVSFELNRCNFKHRLGLLSLFKLAVPPVQKVYINSLSADGFSLSAHYYTTPGDYPMFSLDDKILEPAQHQTRDFRFVGRLFYTRHDVTLTLGEAADLSTFRANWMKTDAVKYRFPGKQRKRPPTFGEIRELLSDGATVASPTESKDPFSARP